MKNSKLKNEILRLVSLIGELKPLAEKAGVPLSEEIINDVDNLKNLSEKIINDVDNLKKLVDNALKSQK